MSLPKQQSKTFKNNRTKHFTMDKLVESLHPLERKIIPFLENKITLQELESRTTLSQVEILRALKWLQNKKAVKVKKEIKEMYGLGKNGLLYAETGLPEIQLLKILSRGAKKPQEIKQLSKQEKTIAIGELKKRTAILMLKDLTLKITSKGKQILKSNIPEQKLINKLKTVKEKENLDKGELKLAHELLKRKELVQIKKTPQIDIELTNIGKRLTKLKPQDDKSIGQLTKSILTSGSWKNKKFRRYNLKEPAPKIHPGKRHFANEAVDYIKKVWLEMGFQEMTGPILDTAFWNFDALFVPQDHPARELQDTFFIKGKKNIKERALLTKVKKTHETGWTTKSKGWQYKFDPEKSKELVLRTHTTSLSARTIANLKKEDLPVKYFSVNKVFRNEAVDWSHAFEFSQVEGIVVDPDANFRHLLGYLKQYYKKLGFEKIRFRPAYFPYTEMSVETEVFVKEKNKWMELGGAGIFRPEVVKPLLGVDVPVLAWGQGMDRSILEYFNIKDLREIHKNDLKKLREIKSWIKCQQ